MDSSRSSEATSRLNVDTRVVAATNRNLEAMLTRGEFREDLYYRLKVIEMTVPPLRERRAEISHLTQFFMERYARRYNRQSRQLSEELRQLFQSYDWPGNIRELENMIKRIVILQDEHLVVREMSRSVHPMPVYASVGIGASPEAIPGRRRARGIRGRRGRSSPKCCARLRPRARVFADVAKRPRSSRADDHRRHAAAGH